MSGLQWSVIEDAIQQWIVAGSGLASDHVIWTGQGGPRPPGQYIAMRLTVLEQRGRDWQDRVDKIITVPTQAITALSTVNDTLTIPAHALVTGDGPLTLTTTGTLPGATPALALLTNYWPVVIDANTIKLATSFQNAMAAVPVVIDLTSAGTGTTSINGTTTTTRAGQEIEFRLRGPRRGILQLQCFAGAPTGAGPTGASSPAALLNDAIAIYALESRAALLGAAGIAIASVDPIQPIDGVIDVVRFEPRAIATVHLHLASELVETTTFIQVVNETNQIVTPPQTFTVQLP